MPVTAIAFDWGGIFTENTFDSSAVRNLARLAGVSEAQLGETYFPLMELFEAGAFDFPEFYRRFVERSGLELDPTRFRETFLGSVVERREMFGVLAAIPAHYTVGMLSNNVPVLCDRVRSDPRMARIEHFIFSNEINVRKPAPEAFAALAKALGRPPEETVFIDDNEANIRACEALGFRGLWLESYEGFAARWQRLLPELPLPAPHGV
ncbi:HAD family hydrolase [Truepera radiovictrix]|uniref:HAD-superfamily hydrolase, subfamily IA, variant 3 n=1 Tax=Truepera radiovictrix (strain DSM 17093 / CIP 108686 / LMG 22925 / RQ-24) TaxID=649638 RepID=D7CV82_TRURR|nr:HAD family phosphatase [Truepera radiovictrix]ADI15909.1 HAD-superfamily hydrolase, subfamily IA, variant 3 [Truepera radiovictrix DSM 17093]WMT58464.1 HAD family phosphatase [Truepera radiovictrix]